MERRRIHAVTGTSGAGGTADVIATIDESNGVNAHGLRWRFAIEPENTDANANGTYALMCLPRQSTAIPSITINALELEADNPAIWAVGVWIASNQTPFTLEIAPKTTRNCPAGTRIVGRISFSGVSAGVVRQNQTMTYFTQSL